MKWRESDGTDSPGERIGMNCYYHPERDAVGVCVTCGRAVCAECKVVFGDKIHCNECADKHLSTPAATASQSVGKKQYSTLLRVLSGLFCAFIVLGSITGLSYYLESGLIAELVVDIVSIIIAVFLLAMTVFPGWVSRKFRIKLEKGSVFTSVFIGLVVLYFVITALGPEPPEGWWNYGTPMIEV